MNHDHGYKRLFSHPEMVRDLLTGFVREPWIADLDFATLEKYPGEFIDDRLQQRRNDVIWRLRRGPDWLYLYVLLEFQSGMHPFMAARLSTYLDLLYQDLIRGRQLGRRRSGVRAACRSSCPSSCTTVAGVGPPPRPGRIDRPRSAAGLDAYRPRLRYLLIDESAYADAELAGMRNLVAAVFRLENSRGPETVREVLAALIAWLAEPEQAELRRSLLLWLREGFLQTRLPDCRLPRTERPGGDPHHVS